MDDIPDVEYFRQLNRIYEDQQKAFLKEMEDKRAREFDEAFQEGLRIEREKREKREKLKELFGEDTDAESSDDSETDYTDDELNSSEEIIDFDDADDRSLEDRARYRAFKILEQRKSEQEQKQKEKEQMKALAKFASEKHEKKIEEFFQKETNKPTHEISSNTLKTMIVTSARGPPTSLDIDEVLSEKNKKRLFKMLFSEDNADGKLSHRFRHIFYHNDPKSILFSRRKSKVTQSDADTAKKVSIGGKPLGRPPKKPEDKQKPPLTQQTTLSEFIFKPIIMNSEIISSPTRGHPRNIGQEFKRPKPGRPKKDEITTPTSALSTSPSPPMVSATRKKAVRAWEVGKVGRPVGSGGGTRLGAPSKRNRF